MRFLSEHISPEQLLPCCIRYVGEALKGSSGFMFDLKSAEIPEPALDN